MECPKCKCEAIISKNRTIFKEEEKKLYRMMSFSCRNKKCTEYQKEIGTKMDELPFSIE